MLGVAFNPYAPPREEAAAVEPSDPLQIRQKYAPTEKRLRAFGVVAFCWSAIAFMAGLAWTRESGSALPILASIAAGFILVVCAIGLLALLPVARVGVPIVAGCGAFLLLATNGPVALAPTAVLVAACYDLVWRSHARYVLSEEYQAVLAVTKSHRVPIIGASLYWTLLTVLGPLFLSALLRPTYCR